MHRAELAATALLCEVPPVVVELTVINDGAGWASVESTVLHLFGTLASVFGEEAMLVASEVSA